MKQLVVLLGSPGWDDNVSQRVLPHSTFSGFLKICWYPLVPMSDGRPCESDGSSLKQWCGQGLEVRLFYQWFSKLRPYWVR